MHGNALGIAGQDSANPLAELLSFSMMLRYSCDMGEDVDLVDSAVENVLAAGALAGNIAAQGQQYVSCSAIDAAVLAELDRLAI